MQLRSLCISIFFLTYLNTTAQVLENSGASSTSMAGLNVNSKNVWSTNNNIGQLSNLEESAVSVNLFQPFLLNDFNTASLVLALKTSNGAFGLNYSNYGNEFLQIHNTGIGYSLKLGENLQSGIKINHFYYDVVNTTIQNLH